MSLRALKAKVSEQRERQLSTLNVVTAGAESYTRIDGVNVIALGHLFAGLASHASSPGSAASTASVAAPPSEAGRWPRACLRHLGQPGGIPRARETQSADPADRPGSTRRSR